PLPSLSSPRSGSGGGGRAPVPPPHPGSVHPAVRPSVRSSERPAGLVRPSIRPSARPAPDRPPHRRPVHRSVLPALGTTRRARPCAVGPSDRIPSAPPSGPSGRGPALRAALLPAIPFPVPPARPSVPGPPTGRARPPAVRPSPSRGLPARPALATVLLPEDSFFRDFQAQCQEEEGWQARYDKDDVVVCTRPPPGPSDGSQPAVHKIKGRVTIGDVPIETVYDVLHDQEYRRTWDVTMLDSFDIARINSTTDVGYYAWKCPKPMKNRDVVTLRTWKVTDDTCMIINFSVTHPRYPPRKDMVRAVSILTGYLLLATGPRSCHLTYLAQLDPKGSLPKWVMNKATQCVAPTMLRRLQKASRRYPAWKREHGQHVKPWRYPEQCTLPVISVGELSASRAQGTGRRGDDDSKTTTAVWVKRSLGAERCAKRGAGGGTGHTGR
uniref:START domain-containing protein 10 n=1 Tax=Ornithorhynchus anatinus TaxID=9258 RepID=A0A6I8MZP4_ORNAN